MSVIPAPPTVPAKSRPASVDRRPRSQHLYTELAAIVWDCGLMERRRGWYVVRIVLMIMAFCAVWVTVVVVGDSWFQLIVAAALGLVVTQFGFLGHDAAHNQMFASPQWNEWTARLLSGVFAGLSYGWWRAKHNRHHRRPNQEGRDPDIAPGAVAFTPQLAEAHDGNWRGWFVRRQGWWFVPLLTLEGLNLHAAGVRTLLSEPRRHRWVELALVISRLSGYVVALLVLLPPGKAAAFFAVQMGVFGLGLGAAFAPNHKGMPIVPPTARIDFLRRQVLVSRNVRGGPLVDFFMGGLNYQIEHHLFPSMPRPNLKRVQPLVREHCRQHAVPYAEVGLLESYRIIVDYLNHVGLRARGPFECPLSGDLRSGARLS